MSAPGTALVLGLVLSLAACASAQPSFTPVAAPRPVVDQASTPVPPAPTPSMAERPTPSTPKPITPEPEPSPWLQAFARHDTARVAVDGLAVRSGPGTGYPLVSGYRWSDAGMAHELETDAVRLAQGHYLVVDHGPLVVHAVPWYLVLNIPQPGEASGEMLIWRVEGNLHETMGWVAGGSDGLAFLEPSEPPPQEDPDHHHHGIPDYAFLAGVGAGRTDAFEMVLPAGVRWHAAGPDGGRCAVQVTLQPAGIEMGSATVDGWAHGQDWWPRDFDPPPGGEHWVEIESDCSWSLAVVQIQG